MISRTTLLAFPSRQSPQFTVERWFLPLDHEVESLTRAALVWHTNDHEYVALMGPAACTQVIGALIGLAGQDDPLHPASWESLR